MAYPTRPVGMSDEIKKCLRCGRVVFEGDTGWYYQCWYYQYPAVDGSGLMFMDRIVLCDDGFPHTPDPMSPVGFALVIRKLRDGDVPVGGYWWGLDETCVPHYKGEAISEAELEALRFVVPDEGERGFEPK